MGGGEGPAPADARRGSGSVFTPADSRVGAGELHRPPALTLCHLCDSCPAPPPPLLLDVGLHTVCVQGLRCW